MEFERAIYRVYERCLEGLQDSVDPEQPMQVNTKSCRVFEVVAFSSATFFLLVLIYLHVMFVGNEGCLPSLLYEKNITNLPYDTILKISLDKQYSTDESGTDMMMTDDVTNNGIRKQRKLSLSPNDITISDKRLRRHSSLSLLSSSSLSSMKGYLKFDHSYKKWNIFGSSSSSSSTSSSSSSSRVIHERLLVINNTINNNTTINNSTISLSPSLSPSSSSSSLYDIGEDFDYEFSPEIAILALPKKAIIDHNFNIVNVTYSNNDQCYGSLLSQLLLPLGGIDIVILNNVIYTMKKKGVLISKTGDYYTWSEKQYNNNNNQTLGNIIIKKISILLFSLMSFMFLSTTTSLIVRILISSGVVLLFPIFWLMHMFGFQIINTRILSLSYPWIGIPMEMLRSRNQSTIPFILSHIFRVIIYYVMYEACQMTFSSWFYDESRPGQKELWIFSIMMLWEYYSMIYIRSSFSIQLFPRASLAIFLLYHFYIYSHPYGFSLLALLVMFLYLTALMIFCVRKYEVDAFFRGLVNIDQPRMIYNQLPWPSWTAALAPDYSLFLPLSYRTSSIYQQAVPAINADNDNQPAPVQPPTFNDHILNATNQTVQVINSITESVRSYVARYSNNDRGSNDRGGNVEINRVNNSSRGTGANTYARLDRSNEEEGLVDVEARR